VTEKVIDSSILAMFLLKEKGWDKARDVLRERPYTLDLAIKETANAIWRRVRLLGDIDKQKALLLLSDLVDIKRLILKIEPQDLYLRQALEIALQYGVTIYDALFIAQAHVKKAILITADKRQYEIASKVGVNTTLISFTS